MAGNTSTPGASVTGRALALVGAFDEAHRRLTLTDLAQRAGLPVAMGQGPDEVRAAAEWITASNDEDGVARALDRLLAER